MASNPRDPGRPASWARWALPSLADVLFAGILLTAVLLGPRMLNMDGDLGRHLTIGRYILDNGRVPVRDLWSHTRPGAELMPHEWLAAVAFALAERAAGLPGVVLLTALVIAGTFRGLARWMLGHGINPYLTVLLVLWAAAASSLHWLTRPHVFTFAFVLAFGWTLDGWRRHAEAGRATPRRLWVLPLLMVVWANTHGAFISGIVLIGLHLAGALWAWRGTDRAAARLARDLAITLGLCLAASLVNPIGPGLLAGSFGYLGQSYLVDRTVEYLAPDFHTIATWPFAGLLLLAIFSARVARPQRNPAALLVVLAWTAFGLYSTRNIPLFALLAVPVLGEWMDAGLAHAAEAGTGWAHGITAAAGRLSRVDQSLAGGAWAVAAAIALSAFVLSRPASDPLRQAMDFSPRVFPVAAVDYLSVHPPEGPVFNNFIWGGYLLYRLWPARQVFIDGQTDFYGEALTREYAQVMALEPGWQAALARYGVRWIIVPPDCPLARELETGALPGWQRAWADDTAVVFVGSSP